MATAGGLPFATSVFSVDVDRVAPHCNPVACVISGIRGAVSVISGSEQVTGEVVLIRPGIEHKVVCEGGINAMYLDGLSWPGGARLAERLAGDIGDLALDAPEFAAGSPVFRRVWRLRKNFADGLPAACSRFPSTW